MTVDEFMKKIDEDYDREMNIKMQEERNNYENYVYEGSLPEEAYIKANDIFRLVDECKAKLLNEGKYLDASGGLYFLDKFAQRIISIFYKQIGDE